ncbi:MAG: HEAT repeat domain-containing protein [Planctomycetota bacterium]|jgi:HEAT repeat protein
MSDDHPPHSRDESSPERVSALQYFVKLILLPGLVVVLLIALWTTVGKLTFSPREVDSLVEALGREGNARWRAAVNLAGVLQKPESEELKRDPVLARRLIEILEADIEAGDMHPDQITLRMYLCRALGEFHVRDPLPVLVKAAQTERGEAEVDVRRSAIEAIAVLAANVGPAGFREGKQPIGALLRATEDRHAVVRSTAAFTLGVVGGRKAEAALVTLLADEHPDVRYNGATGLARHGNAAAVEVLLEMLDPSETAGIEVEKQEAARDSKRTMILVNGLRAAGQLVSANPTTEVSRLGQAVRRLTEADVPDAVRGEAAEVLRKMEP